MTRWTVVSILVAGTVFPLVTLSALRVVTQPWIVHFEIDHGRLPADRFGFTDDDRLRLGLIGLEAIRPGGDGIEILERTTLADGSPAFGTRELRHMEDVRGIVGFLFPLHTTLLGGLLVVVAALWRSRRGREAVARGLLAGAYGTVVIAAVLGLVMLVAWDPFFETFHRLFFEGMTWWFYADDTLRRVYPDAFWMGVAAWLTGLATLFTGLVLALARRWLRRLARDQTPARAGAGATDDERSRAA